MKADVLAVEICFSLAAVPIRGEGIVRAETNQKSLRAVLLRCQGLPFSIELSVKLMGLWYLFFSFFSLRGFSNRHSRIYILGACFIPIMEYWERSGA